MTATDDQWSTERVEPPQARRGVPRWLWGCGIGCGLFALLGLVLGLLGVREVRRMADPERQWARLSEVVPVVERPAEWEIYGFPGLMKMLPGFHGAWLMDSSDRSRHAEIWAFDAEAKDAFTAMFTGEQNASMSWVGVGFYDREPGALTVQGRELRTLRFRTQRPEDVGEAGEAAEAAEPAPAPDERGWWERSMEESGIAKAAVNVDLTTDPPGDPLVLIQYSTPGKLERIDDQELVEFLAHFDLAGD